NLADPADVRATSVDLDDLAFGVEHVGVLSGHADGERAVLIDQSDDLTVDLAGENHADDVHRLVGGHPQSRGEGRLHPCFVEHRTDLWSATVHHDGSQARVMQEDDGLRETNTEFVVDHGVAAVLDHDGAAVETGEPGQRLDEVGGLVHGLGLFFVVCGCRGSRDHVWACLSSLVGGSAKIWAARSAHTLAMSAWTPSSPRPVASAQPLARHSTVSLVPVSGANTSAVTACARCRHWSSVRSASVVSKQIGRASCRVRT